MATPVTSFNNPNSSNVFVPGAQQQLQVEFSRNPARFNINRYVQWIPTDKPIGFYPELSTSDAVRVVNQSNFLWPDGTDRPAGNTRGLRWKKFACERRAYDFTLGHRTVRNASFDVVAAYARGRAVTAMTDRTIDAITVLTTAGNWDASSTVASATAAGGGPWNAATAANQDIRDSFQTAVKQISKATGGAVTSKDILCIVNPVNAHIMAKSDEIRAYLVNHEMAIAALGDQGILPEYGLPRYLYGVEIVVEDAVYNADNPGSTTANTYVMADNDAVFVSRVGGLMGTEGINFSTLIGFLHEDMAVELIDDSWNRKINGSVVDDRDIVLAAGVSGYFIQDVNS